MTCFMKRFGFLLLFLFSQPGHAISADAVGPFGVKKIIVSARINGVEESKKAMLERMFADIAADIVAANPNVRKPVNVEDDLSNFVSDDFITIVLLINFLDVPYVAVSAEVSQHGHRIPQAMLRELPRLGFKSSDGFPRTIKVEDLQKLPVAEFTNAIGAVLNQLYVDKS